MIEKLRRKNGITLIALVITIILLIILAGVGINLSLGENGIFNKTKEAKEKEKISEYIEKIELSKGEVHTEKLGKGNIDDLIQKIYDNKIVPDGNITKINDETAKILAVEGYVFEVTMRNTVYLAKQDVLIEEITLNKTSTIVVVGKTETLTVTILPKNAIYKDLAWTSSDNSIATVSEGIITGIAKGTAIITATAADGSGKSVSCDITVIEEGQSWSYNYIGEDQTYTVPIIGEYKIELSGAQGGNSTYNGGKGGKTIVSINLAKGDIITVKVGGQGETYNGGGTGTTTNGGGATSILINNNLVAIAGGGGGGTTNTEGGAGGATEAGNNNTAYIGSNSTTADSAGGGGGYIGGKASSTVAHKHVSSCYTTQTTTCNGPYSRTGYDPPGDAAYNERVTCGGCGATWDGMEGHPDPGEHTKTVSVLACSKKIDSYVSSYGGSNWYDSTKCVLQTSEAATQVGNGICNIQIVKIN